MSKSSKLTIPIQIFKEFWLPFTAAALWSFYSMYNSADGFRTKDVLSSFGASFFFFSWMTGQFFRVRKQVAVERSFGSLEARVEGMVSKIETETDRMISNVTGGKSFAYVIVGAPNRINNISDIILVHAGDYPIQEVTISMADLDMIDPSNPNIAFEAAYRSFHVSMLLPGRAAQIGKIDFGNATSRKFNIFFAARNGAFVQMLRMVRHNGEWETATRVVPQGIKHDQDPMFENITPNYPVARDNIVFS